MNSPSGLIIHPADIEKMTRRSIELAPRKTSISLLVALSASVEFGNAWFAVGHVAAKIDDKLKERGHLIAVDLKNLSVVDLREVDCGNYKRIEARLTLKLADINHHHGRRSHDLLLDHQIFYRKFSDASLLSTLILIGLRCENINLSNLLAKFMAPEFDHMKSPSAAPKIFRKLEDAGIVEIRRDNGNPPFPYFVLPVIHESK